MIRTSGLDLPLRTRAAIVALGLFAGGAGAALCLLAAPHLPAHPTPLIVVPLLVLAYLVGGQVSLDLEFRSQTNVYSLTQIPLALGLVFVAPHWHLLARLAAVAVEQLLLRRQPPEKATYNTGLSLLEVGVATATSSALLGLSPARPGLWLGVLAALLAADAVGLGVMQLLFRVLRQPTRPGELWSQLAVALTTTLLFACVSVVVVSAVLTDSFVAVVIVVLAGALALGYRGHRQLAAREARTSKLYELVKQLGPLDADQDVDTVPQVLERIRDLLHAGYLDLGLCEVPGGSWRHLVVQAAGGTPDPGAPPVVPELVAPVGQPLLEPRDSLHEDRMTTPLISDGVLLGVLSAGGRVGATRGFDLDDLRLLETVAATLLTALERGRLHRDLARAATVDSLTDLPNAAETASRLQRRLDDGEALVLAVLTVASFRDVNDSLGHGVGDDLIREVGRRLLAFSPSALSGRLGGGRFAFALPAHESTAGPEMLGLALRAALEGTAVLPDVTTHLRIVVGVVSAPEHGRTAALLLRRAETAMHAARANGGGPVLWEPAYEVRGQRRIAITSALREAVAGGGIGLAYQPKVDCAGQPTGVEALARWTHPALGVVGPDEFVPLAEASGLMGELTATVLTQALTACRGWQGRAPGVGVAVNVSASTLLGQDLHGLVLKALVSTGTPAALLTLELTESVVLADADLAVRQMHALKAIGVTLSLDDFGTGYSSLTYLKGLPVDEVKIDRGFVAGVVHDNADQAVVRSVVELARAFGMRVVAEGIEQADQLEVVRALGVTETQGYLHGRPMHAALITDWLRAAVATRRV